MKIEDLQEENKIQRQITGRTRSRTGELAAAIIQTGFLTTYTIAARNNRAHGTREGEEHKGSPSILSKP